MYHHRSIDKQCRHHLHQRVGLGLPAPQGGVGIVEPERIGAVGIAEASAHAGGFGEIRKVLDHLACLCIKYDAFYVGIGICKEDDLTRFRIVGHTAADETAE